VSFILFFITQEKRRAKGVFSSFIQNNGNGKEVGNSLLYALN
jgi:hypothetical protein